MICAATAQIKREASLGDFSARERIANFRLVQKRCKFSLRHQLEKEFKLLFVRGRNHRVRSLEFLPFYFESERRVLPRKKFKRAAGIDTNQPEIFTEILAPQYFRRVVLLTRKLRLSQCACLRKFN